MKWYSLLAFLRLVTNPRIFEKPESASTAWKQVEAWLDCPTVWLPQPSENHRNVLISLFASQDIQGNWVPEVHLAALAIEHGLILCSTDGDFARFQGSRWGNPLLTE